MKTLKKISVDIKERVPSQGCRKNSSHEIRFNGSCCNKARTREAHSSETVMLLGNSIFFRWSTNRTSSICDFAGKGGSPVNISNKIAPTDHKSVLMLYFCNFRISGA